MKPRRPFAKDPQLDYTVMEDEEWEPEPEGDSLSVGNLPFLKTTYFFPSTHIHPFIRVQCKPDSQGVTASKWYTCLLGPCIGRQILSHFGPTAQNSQCLAQEFGKPYSSLQD